MRDRIVQAAAFGVLLATGVGVAVFGSAFYAQSLFTAALFILLSLGWNVIGGIAGYVSFGQVSFFGFGAYVAAVAMVHLQWPWYVATPVAAGCAAALALVLGGIMLRLQGIFFALGMFGLARILQLSASSLDVTGGPMGTTVTSAESANVSALVMVLAAGAGTLLTYALTRTRLGLRLMAIKDDAVAAQAAGINTYPMKVVALCISAAFAAVGGGLYVWNVGYLDPGSAFNGNIELQTVLMVLAGGIGTVWGPVIGGVVMSIVGTLLWARFPMQQQIVLGGLTILIAVFMPGGVMAALNRRGWLVREPIWGPPRRLDAIPLSPSCAPSSAKGSVLVCKDLRAHFGGVFAVKGVNLEARAGEMLAIIGPNGAGKSTVFNLISSFLRGGGEVHFEDRRVDGLPPHTLACGGIARTFQTSRLFASLTVWETVLVAASSVNRSRAVAIHETTRMLEETELIGHWAELPDTLPPGRQRLLEIARALALKPRVLLLDEAMAGMTHKEIERVHVALKHAMARGCAVIAIEHVLPAIADLSSNAHVLDFGRTIAEGAPRKVLRDPVVIEAYMGADHAGSTP